MKLGWYIARLRSMGPAELLHRLDEKRRKIVSRGRDEGWERYPASALRPVFPGLRAVVNAARPAARAAIADAAGKTLAGHFAALGRAWPKRDPANLFPPDLWRLDPVTGQSWPGPKTYAFDIDFRHDGSLGDVKYVWEINRLQFLPPLAAHLLLEGDDRSRIAIEAAIDSWHGANPPFRGVGWASGIEVALRAVSLIVALDLVSDRLSDKTIQQAGEILAASAHWLPRFPSLHSSANNHRVAELAGEYLVGVALGTDGRSARDDLVAEVRKQILADGSGAEQSPTYAAFIAEMILLSALAARMADEPFPLAAYERLSAFADFIDWLGPETGFGDDDEGRVLTSGDEPHYAQSVGSAIRGFLRQPRNPALPDDFRSLFFGWPSEPADPPRGLKTFAEGGLSVWHGEIGERQIDLTFDHGPLGYLSIAAHGHADALSLTLSVDGRPVLVDPGTYLYGSGGIWRDWFRSTPAHNTLNIKGESQSIMSSKFNWSHKASTTLVASDPPPNWSLRARHDGYRRRFGVVHDRTVARHANGIEVTDRLLGGTHMSEIVFQLAPELATRQEGAVVTIYADNRSLMKILLPSDEITISRGDKSPGEGWVSSRFGVKNPADRVVWHGKVGENGVITRFLPAGRME
ncbi:heparinase II/III family protein [Rhizobium sp. LjRoot254]|uniref:heparinase II/III family protein n=1 Tax=Rhizobium sp. LjRoot254 TaxID=3342297 RepID=UPI003ECFA776